MDGKGSVSLPHGDLGERLRRLREETTPLPGRRADQPASGLGMAFACGAHMVAGLAVGAGIGYLLDGWLSTSPWLFVVFFFLGAAAGILNTYRTATGMGMALGYRPAEKGTEAHRQEDEPPAGDQETKDQRGGNRGGQSA
ncbi:MAG: AtpZ/AtpI family protein [Rhodospirillales bacterium]|nr:MAG: AtpZ/AtpI family protein [Rhodospirillales bacterium]